MSPLYRDMTFTKLNPPHSSEITSRGYNTREPEKPK